MRYVALLRGINVGGNALVRMADLRECALGIGLEDVSTYIASGNLLFSSGERSGARIEPVLERALEHELGLPIRVVVRSRPEVDRIVARIPPAWIGAPHLRVTVAFLLREANARRIAASLTPRDGIDELTTTPGALLWAIRRDALTRTGLRLIGTDAYRLLTARNLNTTLKLAELLRA
jgi:uncharacterized protein (DUF1697 family)